MHAKTGERVLVLDGAMATELESAGADLNNPLWSAKVLIEAPEMIEEVHYRYLCAGADIITTVTYQASLPGFRNLGLKEVEIQALFSRANQLARSARSRYLEERSGGSAAVPRIAASVGPYGAYLADGSEYTGNYDIDRVTLHDFHFERLQVILRDKPDLIILETIPDLKEAEVLLAMLAELPPVEIWLSFSCRDEKHISDGTSFAEAVSLVASSPGIGAVGVNCLPPAWVSSLLKAAVTVSSLPLLVYPNSGETWDGQEKCWRPRKGHSKLMPSTYQEWVTLGAQIIGGCCRTSPAMIAEIREALSDVPGQI